MINNTPKVSVIVPVYNAARFLDACLESILKQDYPNFEVLMIDDGSKDNSLAILRKYLALDSRIQVYHHENRGVSFTRNRGIDLSSGDYILFIDSDDTIEESYISEFLRTDFRSFDLIIQGINFGIDGRFNKYSPGEGEYSKAEIARLFVEKNFINCGGPYVKLYSRHLICKNNLRFRENIRFGEDLIFFMEYLNHVQKIKCISYVGYNYLIRTSNASLTQCLNSYDSELEGLFYIQKTLQPLVPQAEYSVGIKEFISRLSYRVILSGLSERIPIKTVWTDLVNIFELKYYFVLSAKRFILLNQLFILSPRLYLFLRFSIKNFFYPYE